jgi:TPR repeat protein
MARSEAVHYFKAAADQNSPRGQCAYAHCLASGIGIEIDLIESAEYYRLAGEHGSAQAQLAYAQCFALGKGVPTDLIQSARYFQKAADQDDPEAQFHYGLCLATGDGVRIDPSECVRYLRMAIRSHDHLPDAGEFCSETRFGVLLTPTRAQTLYNRATSNRHVSTLNQLGKCLEFGKHAKKDVFLAANCYSASAGYGDSNGQVNIGFCL